MPLYEYQCQKCKTHLEKIQKFSDPPLTKCEKCGGRLEQLLSSPAFQFKGSGWYVTDYARKSDGAKEKQPSADGKETEAKSSETAKPKKTETKKASETSKTSESSKTSEPSSVTK